MKVEEELGCGKCRHPPSFEQLYGCKRMSRPRPEAIKREVRWPSRRHFHVQVVVIFPLPILIRWVASGTLLCVLPGSIGSCSAPPPPHHPQYKSQFFFTVPM